MLEVKFQQTFNKGFKIRMPCFVCKKLLNIVIEVENYLVDPEEVICGKECAQHQVMRIYEGSAG